MEMNKHEQRKLADRFVQSRLKKNNYKAYSRAVVASMGTHSTKDTTLKTKTENHPPKA